MVEVTTNAHAKNQQSGYNSSMALEIVTILLPSRIRTFSLNVMVLMKLTEGLMMTV